MHSFALSEALDKLERATENLSEGQSRGFSAARLAVLTARVQHCEREVKVLQAFQDAKEGR